MYVVPKGTEDTHTRTPLGMVHVLHAHFHKLVWPLPFLLCRVFGVAEFRTVAKLKVILMSVPDKLFVQLFFASESLLNLFGLANRDRGSSGNEIQGGKKKNISSVGV